MSTAKIYGQDLGLVRVSDLLSAIADLVDITSGGPGAEGAVPIRTYTGSKVFVWSAMAVEGIGDAEIGLNFIVS
jgi:hypothetical protein